MRPRSTPQTSLWFRCSVKMRLADARGATPFSSRRHRKRGAIDGRLMPLQGSPARILRALCRPKSDRSRHHLAGCAGRRACSVARNTASSIWSTRLPPAAPAALSPWPAFVLIVALSRRTTCCGVASWIASYAFVEVTGDLRSRTVPPPHRPRAELFRRPPARHAGQPHHRHLERGLPDRKHGDLERAAALRRDDGAPLSCSPRSARRWQRG